MTRHPFGSSSPEKLLRWFVDNLDTPPERLHSRGVWADPKDGAGSKLGTPQINRAFRDWLEESVRATRTERVEETCYHPQLVAEQDANECPDCKGLHIVVRTRTYFRWPMRAAIARLAGWNGRKGRPDFAATALHLMWSRGDTRSAQELLTRTHPVMGDDAVAADHFRDTLWRVRTVYREEVPPSPLRAPERSEAQLDAEAVVA